MVVFYLAQILHKLVHLLLAQLQSVFQLFVHQLAQFELVGWAQVCESCLLVVEHFLL